MDGISARIFKNALQQKMLEKWLTFQAWMFWNCRDSWLNERSKGIWVNKEVTGVNINQDCLESCHPLPSKEKEQDYS